MMSREIECPECKGEQLITYSYSRGQEYCRTCKGLGTIKNTND